jgi:plastocyanin
MKLVKQFGSAVLVAVALMTLAACGGDSGTGGGSSTAQEIGAKGDDLAFDKAALAAPANTPFTVKFNNTSTVNMHNWILVKGGDDVAAKVDEAATTAGPDAGYLPTTPDVIAGGKQLAAGANETINVAGIPAGTYTYICTTPGHYAAGMKGTLTVQ